MRCYAVLGNRNSSWPTTGQSRLQAPQHHRRSTASPLMVVSSPTRANDPQCGHCSGIRKATGRSGLISTIAEGLLAALRFMWLVVKPTLGIERFAFPVERRCYAFSQMSRLGQKIIDVPQSFSEHRRLQRIHSDRHDGLQSVLPIVVMSRGKGDQTLSCPRRPWSGITPQPAWPKRVQAREGWWPGTELNRRHHDFQSCALPTELPGLPKLPR